MKNHEQRLISDKGLLFFLEQFKIEDAEYEKTKELLKMKMSGENPSFDEWRANAIAIAIPNVNAIDRAYGATIDCAYDIVRATAAAYVSDADSAYDADSDYDNDSAYGNARDMVYDTAIAYTYDREK